MFICVYELNKINLHKPSNKASLNCRQIDKDLNIKIKYSLNDKIMKI